MAEIPLIQASKITGIAYATLKKQSQRGQLRVKMIDGRTYVEEDDLQAYMATREFADLHPRIVGQELNTVAREAGSMVARLPEKVRGAMLDGIPTERKVEALLDAMDVVQESDDPHFGFDVGYTHKENPKWKRVNAGQWKLGSATWTFSPDPNHLGRDTWIGGGSREGAQLAPGFSPSNPHRYLRPLGSGD